MQDYPELKNMLFKYVLLCKEVSFFFLTADLIHVIDFELLICLRVWMQYKYLKITFSVHKCIAHFKSDQLSSLFYTVF